MPAQARVVVVDYDGADVLPACLTSLIATVPPDIPVTVLDNASPSPSTGLLPDTIRSRIEVIRLEQNVGYAGAIEKAWSIGTEPMLIIANNDLKFEPGWLESLLEFARNENAHAVSATIVHESDSELEKTTNASLNVLLYLVPGVFKDRTKAVFPSGACFLLRREPGSAAPVDPEYFLYYEDVYIGFLLHSLGKKVVQCPSARVQHAGSHSAKRWDRNRLAFLRERNRILTMILFFDWWLLLGLSPLILLDLILKVPQCLVKKRPVLPTLKAHWWIAANLPQALRKRAAIRRLDGFDSRRILPYLSLKLVAVPVFFPVFLFAVSTCLAFRGALPTWGDETFTLRLVDESWPQFWTEILQDVHPPLYFLASRLAGVIWSGFPADPGVRALAYLLHVILNGLTVLLVFRKTGEVRQTFATALLLASSAHLALFGPMLRYYSLAAIGVVCATMLLLPDSFCRHQEPPYARRSRAVLYALSLVTAFSSSYLTAVVLPAHLICILRKPFLERRAFLTALAISLAAAFPVFCLMTAQMKASASAFHAGIAGLLAGAIARGFFSLFSFALGEFVRPWDWMISIPALASVLYLLFLGWLERRSPSGSLIWLTFLTALPLGAIVLAWVGVGTEFSASRLMFLAPLFAGLLAHGCAGGRPAPTAALAVLVAANLFSTFNFSRQSNWIQSTYSIPWEDIAEDAVREIRANSVIVFDDDTLKYWIPEKHPAGPTQESFDSLTNVNLITDPEDYLSRSAFSRVVMVYSPRGVTEASLLKGFLETLSQSYHPVSEKRYLTEDENSIRWKSMLLRRPVEPVKKVLVVYEHGSG